jgi:hypothetical protein
MRSVISGAFFTAYRWPIVLSGAAALIDVLSAGLIAPLVGWATAVGAWALTAARATPVNGAHRNEAVREVDQQLGRMRAELGQIRCILRDATRGLSGSCTDLGLASREQAIIVRLLSRELSQACPVDRECEANRIKTDLEVVSQHVSEHLGRLNNLARGTEGHVARVVTSLQFEDIVSQILAHITRRVDAVSLFMDVLGEAGEASGGIGIERGRPGRSADLAERLGAARQLAQETTQRAVRQECLTDGAVDLF